MDNEQRLDSYITIAFEIYYAIYIILSILSLVISFLSSTNTFGIILRIVLLASVVIVFFFCKIYYRIKLSALSIFMTIVLTIVSLISTFLSIYFLEHASLIRILQTIFYPLALLSYFYVFNGIFLRVFKKITDFINLLLVLKILFVLLAVYFDLRMIFDSTLNGVFVYNSNRTLYGYILFFGFLLSFETPLSKWKYSLSVRHAYRLFIYISIILCLSKIIILLSTCICLAGIVLNHNKKLIIVSVSLISIALLGLLFVFIVSKNSDNFLVQFINSNLITQIYWSGKSRIESILHISNLLFNPRIIIGYGYGLQIELYDVPVDNHYIQSLLSNGILGLIMLVAFIYASFRQSKNITDYRKKNFFVVTDVSMIILLLFYGSGPLNLGVFFPLFMLVFIIVPRFQSTVFME